MTWIREQRLDPYDNDDGGAGQWAEAMLRARIPRRFWSADVGLVRGNNTWIRQALERQDFWAAKGLGFFIHGDFNTGKSAAAAIIARDFVERCHVVSWLAVRDVPGTRFRDTPDSASMDDRLKRTDLLVLDDLGSERFRLESAAGAALEETIRILYEAQRPVIITSNKSFEQFCAAYSRAFVSLMRRMVFVIALVDPWDSAPSGGMI